MGAIEQAPKTCACGKRLPKPHYHKRELHMKTFKWYCKHCEEPTLPRDDVWAVYCTHCKRFYQWCYPACYKITSSMPLFNTREIVT